MRFSAAAIALLPGLAAAQESSSPLDQLKTQFRHSMTQLVSLLPNPGTFDPAAAAAARQGPMRLSILSLENWRDTLYEPLVLEAKTSEEWWVMITGRNKTCYGHCGRLESAFTEAAASLADIQDAPRVALLNCDDQPILCNSWTATPGHLWAFPSMLPPTETSNYNSNAHVDIYKKKFNLTSVSADDFLQLHAAGDRKAFALVDSWFHPINGRATELGLSVPFGYLVWAFNLVPQWALMLVVSLVSRSLMSRRVAATVGKQQSAAGQKKRQ